MSRHSNQLSPAEAEALALLAEEAAEVVQCVTKILRHGPLSTNPDNKKNPKRTNTNHLCKELGDMAASIRICTAYGMVHTGLVKRAENLKLRNIGQYLHHADIPDDVKKEISIERLSKAKK